MIKHNDNSTILFNLLKETKLTHLLFQYVPKLNVVAYLVSAISEIHVQELTDRLPLFQIRQRLLDTYAFACSRRPDYAHHPTLRVLQKGSQEVD